MYFLDLILLWLTSGSEVSIRLACPDLHWAFTPKDDNDEREVFKKTCIVFLLRVTEPIQNSKNLK